MYSRVDGLRARKPKLCKQALASAVGASEENFGTIRKNHILKSRSALQQPARKPFWSCTACQNERFFCQIAWLYSIRLINTWSMYGNILRETHGLTNAWFRCAQNVHVLYRRLRGASEEIFWGFSFWTILIRWGFWGFVFVLHLDDMANSYTTSAINVNSFKNDKISRRKPLLIASRVKMTVCFSEHVYMILCK